MRKVTAVAAAAIAGGIVATVVASALARRARRPEIPRRTGVGPLGMEYEVFGDGPKIALMIQGGPGSEIPEGIAARMAASRNAPYVLAGYTVWNVTRRRHMPQGHTIADMADDYAAFAAEHLPGGVDLAIGTSFGGLVAQYLAANHPELVRLVVLNVAAATVAPFAAELDIRWAAARAEGRYDDAGAIFLEYVIPGPERAAVRARFGPLAGRMFADSPVPAEDLRIEAAAEAAFDSRAVLGGIRAPVLLICGENDHAFPAAIVDETEALIPDCTVVRYAGMGHVRAAMNSRTPMTVLGWVAHHPVR